MADFDLSFCEVNPDRVDIGAAMADTTQIDLSLDDCRAVTGYAVLCARSVLPVFEKVRPGDMRPRDAIDAAQLFADGAKRTKLIRDNAWSALRTAKEMTEIGESAASEAARAADAAAGAAYLHPLAKATQTKHILGSAAHAVRTIEVVSPNDAGPWLAILTGLATPAVSIVLQRYPASPSGGGRVGQLIRDLDDALRRTGIRASEQPVRSPET